MWASILEIAAPMAIRLMKWLGFREEQVAKFMLWVHRQQLEAPKSTLPAEQDAAAEAKLRERLKAETAKDQGDAART